MPRKSSHFLRVERATKVEARDLAREIDLLRGFVLGLTLFSPTLLGGVTLFVRQVCRRIVGAMGRVWQPCLRPRRRFICSVLPPSGVFMGGVVHAGTAC